jgi:hypothetical protein
MKHTQKAFLVLAAVAIILAILVFLATVADGVVNVVDQPLAV